MPCRYRHSGGHGEHVSDAQREDQPAGKEVKMQGQKRREAVNR